MSDPSYTIDVGGDDYLIVHKIGTGCDLTEVYPVGDSEPLLTLRGLYADEAAKALVRGYRQGIKDGRKLGRADTQATLRVALGLASLEDVAAIDNRVEKLEGQQRYGF